MSTVSQVTDTQVEQDVRDHVSGCQPPVAVPGTKNDLDNSERRA